MVTCGYCGFEYHASWGQKGRGCPRKPHIICSKCASYNGKGCQRCRTCGNNNFFKMGTKEAKAIFKKIREMDYSEQRKIMGLKH